MECLEIFIIPYLVHPFRGYSNSYCTLEPVTNLSKNHMYYLKRSH